MDQWVKDLLERQAVWQRRRASLPWEVKLRQSLVMREAQRALRGAAGKAALAAEKQRPPRPLTS